MNVGDCKCGQWTYGKWNTPAGRKIGFGRMEMVVPCRRNHHSLGLCDYLVLSPKKCCQHPRRAEGIQTLVHASPSSDRCYACNPRRPVETRIRETSYARGFQRRSNGPWAMGPSAIGKPHSNADERLAHCEPSFHFNVFVSNALTAPSYVLQCIIMVIVIWHSDQVRERSFHGAFGSAWQLVGWIILRAMPDKASCGVKTLPASENAPLGIVTVPVQDGWADGRTDNRPVPSLGCRSPQCPVPSPDGGEDGRPVHRTTDDGRMDGYNALPRHLTSATNLGAAPASSQRSPLPSKWLDKLRGGGGEIRAYLLTGRPSTVDGRPVHRPVPSSAVREAVPPYRRRTVHWTAVFGAVRRPGRTVTIPTHRVFWRNNIRGEYLCNLFNSLLASQGHRKYTRQTTRHVFDHHPVYFKRGNSINIAFAIFATLMWVVQKYYYRHLNKKHERAYAASSQQERLEEDNQAEKKGNRSLTFRYTT
ncbi:hypothetical protein DFH08DRAFT_804224 [Mycena albidolilacea]|uniref:Uncharacterized protein n=1 Tax=Mycena albidolilacea TaxID=1033008 RepID=A0AAD7ABH8_9AGAR|nr:hypothetical protein DFH08DRAFT_804224 [Mycena albidolilacea]